MNTPKSRGTFIYGMLGRLVYEYVSFWNIVSTLDRALPATTTMASTVHTPRSQRRERATIVSLGCRYTVVDETALAIPPRNSKVQTGGPGPHFEPCDVDSQYSTNLQKKACGMDNTEELAVRSQYRSGRTLFTSSSNEGCRAMDGQQAESFPLLTLPIPLPLHPSEYLPFTWLAKVDTHVY